MMKIDLASIIPVVAVVGKKELENQNLSVISRQNRDLGILDLADLSNYLQTA